MSDRTVIFIGHFPMIHQVFSWYPDDRNGAEWQVVRGSGMKAVIWQVKGASG